MNENTTHAPDLSLGLNWTVFKPEYTPYTDDADFFAFQDSIPDSAYESCIEPWADTTIVSDSIPYDVLEELSVPQGNTTVCQNTKVPDIRELEAVNFESTSIAIAPTTDPLVDASFYHKTKGYIFIGHLDEKDVWHQRAYSLEKLPTVLKSLVGKTDYWLSQAVFKTSYSRKIENVRCIQCFFLDLDYVKTAYANYTPEDLAEIISGTCCIEDFLEPNLLTSTGNGLQVKWCLSKPLAISNPFVLALWVAVQNFLLEYFLHFGADPQALDASRVLRIPGALNGKDKVKYDRVTKILSGYREAIEFDEILNTIFKLDILSTFKGEKALRLLDAQNAVNRAWETVNKAGCDVYYKEGMEDAVIGFSEQPQLDVLFSGKILTPEDQQAKLRELQDIASSSVLAIHKSPNYGFRKGIFASLCHTSNDSLERNYYYLDKLATATRKCVGLEDCFVSVGEFSGKSSKVKELAYIQCCPVEFDYNNTKYAGQKASDVAKALNEHLITRGIPLPSSIIESNSGCELHVLWILNTPIKIYSERSLERWKSLLKHLAMACRDFGARAILNATSLIRIPGSINSQAKAEGRDPVVKLVGSGSTVDFDVLCDAVFPVSRSTAAENKLKAEKNRKQATSVRARVSKQLRDNSISGSDLAAFESVIPTDNLVSLKIGDSRLYGLINARVTDLLTLVELRRVSGYLPQGSREIMVFLLVNFLSLLGKINLKDFDNEAIKIARLISLPWAEDEFKTKLLGTLKRRFYEETKLSLSDALLDRRNYGLYKYRNETLIRLLNITPEEMAYLKSIKPPMSLEKKREARREYAKAQRKAKGATPREESIIAQYRDVDLPPTTLYRRHALLKNARAIVGKLLGQNGEVHEASHMIAVSVITNLECLCRNITTLEEYKFTAINIARELAPSWAITLNPTQFAIELQTFSKSLNIKRAQGNSDIYLYMPTETDLTKLLNTAYSDESTPAEEYKKEEVKGSHLLLFITKKKFSMPFYIFTHSSTSKHSNISLFGISHDLVLMGSRRGGDMLYLVVYLTFRVYILRVCLARSYIP